MGLTGFDISSKFMGENQSYKRQTINNSKRWQICSNGNSSITFNGGSNLELYSSIFKSIFFNFFTYINK